jgi:hypothetical protein
VPVIHLLKETPKEAVCQVFEKVNTGGVALTVFELMTATYAADNFRLTEDWKARRVRLDQYAPLAKLEGTDFLTAVTLLASYRRRQGTNTAVSCKRKDILRLTLGEYQISADEIEDGFVKTARFLARENVFDEAGLPYQAQLIALAATCAVLDRRFEEDDVRTKLARWYWCGVFGELYGGASESRLALDLQDVIGWIAGGVEPRSIRDANFAPTRLLSMQTRQSAAYKGIMARLMQEGSQDFLSGDSIDLVSYFDLSIDIHHIFPRAYCEKQSFPRQRWNSVVNKAPLSARTNRIIGGHKPSTYLNSIERSVLPVRLDDILRSHMIDPELLRGDDFDLFIRRRATSLLDLVERAMGKPVDGRESEEVLSAFGGPLNRRPSPGFTEIPPVSQTIGSP